MKFAKIASGKLPAELSVNEDVKMYFKALKALNIGYPNMLEKMMERSKNENDGESNRYN